MMSQVATTRTNISRADLHVHSKYSDRPSEWILRRVGAPESFTEPLDIYRRCRERGMDFFTISDHNCIEAALEIADLPGTFLSTEVTTYFPENGAKVHCLVLGFNEAQWREIDRLRPNIYEMRKYLLAEDIIYSVAHPLFRVNDRLSVDQLEKLLVMFNRFEGINGTRDPRAANLVKAIFRNLTPELIEQMADKHGLEPLGPTPWIKTFTGGSDDHGGLYIASAWTETPRARTVEEFLEHIRQGRHEMGGDSGTSLRLAHSFYEIAYSYYKTRLFDDTSARHNVLGDLFDQLLTPTDNGAPGWLGKARGVAGRLMRDGWKPQLSPTEQTLAREIGALFAEREESRRESQPAQADDQRIFQIACDVSQKLSYAFVQRFLNKVGEGELIESLQTLASLGPVFLSVAPYLAAFRTQHKDEAFLQETAERFPAAGALRSKGEGRAWITDTFSDFNGVARTVRSLGEAALRDGKQLTIVTCDSAAAPTDGIRLKNFTPLGEFEMPEYRTQRLSMPPLLEMIEYLERERFNELIISTPGPLGLCALLAARLLGLKTSGIYHTDFPRYVRCHTHDEALERVTSWFMNWFYNQVDRVYVPSESYRKQLTSLGVEAGRIRLFGHGVDTNLFNPSRKQAGWWKARGLGDGFNYLYVGRISREKNLGLLLDTFADVRKRMPDANLLIVGDGPLREKLEARKDAGVAFTGWLDGEELATAFAGGDVLVFPSTTDTFGNVVLEAHACGLPAIVSHRGGPREIVARHGSGLIVNVDHPHALCEAMLAMPSRPDLAELREKSLRTAQESRWESVLDALWKGESFPQGIAETDIVEADSELDEDVLLALDFA